VQRHLRAWRCPLNQTSRRTGARFVASHATIFDLDLHELSPDLTKAPYMGEHDASINPTWGERHTASKPIARAVAADHCA
jgi:hypothetical protein